MTTTAKAPREKLTLRDTTDLLLALNAWVEEHVDEIELNGGALPDDLAALLDEIDASRMDRADAIAAKLDEFSGYAAAAKATKDRAARREKVWNNAIAALKAYALREVLRLGGGWIKGKVATLRIQRNSAPAVECRFDNEQLCAFADTRTDEQDEWDDLVEHPLAKYITVERVATLDKKAIGAAYEARRAELERAIADQQGTQIGDPERYIADALAQEFPGITCIRGSHLRVD